MSRSGLKVILVGKLLSFPWATGNLVRRSLIKMGCRVVPVDLIKHEGRLEKLCEIQQEHDADLLLTMKGHGIDPRWIAAVKCPTILWYSDDAIEWQIARDDFKSYGHVYDHVYYFDAAGLDLLRSLGVKDPKFLPCATDPEFFRRYRGMRKEYDVSFVGHISPDRRKMLDKLKERFNVHAVTVYMDEMVAVYNKSKINFNRGVGDTGYQLRVFEALGMGGFLLTNEIPVEYRLLEDRKHLVYYNNDNVEDLITYYLNHDEERDVIAQNGYEEVVRKHTFDRRVHQILADVL